MTQASQTPTDKNKQHPIVIAGGGLVGFSLALMLAKKGIASTMVEAGSFVDTSKPIEEDTSYISLDSRNIALSRKSVEIYKSLGLWGSLQSHSMPIMTVDITEKDSFGHARLLAHEEKVENFGQATENRWLGRHLLHEAKQQSLITLIDNATIVDVQQDADSVTLHYSKKNPTDNTSTQETINAKLLVAADGQHSFCRKALGVATKTKDYKQSAIVTVVETSQPHDQIAYERFSTAGPLALIPLAGKTADDQSRRSVVWITKKGEEDQFIGEHTDEHFLQTISEAFGDMAGDFVKVGKRGSYPLTQVIAEKQVVGRTVILGNAAHTLHPVAGQGFNLCMRDAVSLTERLDTYLQSHHDLADTSKLAAMLADYEKVRLKDQKKVIFFCDSVVRGFSNNNVLLKLARNTGLFLFENIPGFKPMVANFAMGLKSK